MAGAALIKCYWILQNVRVTAFTVSELLRGNNWGVKLPPPPPTYPPRLGLRDIQHVTRHEVSCLINYNTLFQNATDIITKCDPTFLQNAPEVYYKMRQVFYYKMRQ